MKNSISTIGSGLLVSVSLTIATTAASAQSIQYGGDWEHLVGTDAQDANWRAAVGADQVIK